MNILCVVSVFSCMPSESVFKEWKLGGLSLCSWTLKKINDFKIFKNIVVVSREELEIDFEYKKNTINNVLGSFAINNDSFSALLNLVSELSSKTGEKFDAVFVLHPSFPMFDFTLFEKITEKFILHDLDLIRTIDKNINLSKIEKRHIKKTRIDKNIIEELKSIPWTEFHEAFGPVSMIKINSLVSESSRDVSNYFDYPLEDWQALCLDSLTKLPILNALANELYSFNNKTLKDKNIELLVFDFDGVLTNNKVLLLEDGKEAVVCDRGDGLGFSLLKKMNIPILVLSSEVNPVVQRRCEKLKLACYNGVKNKKNFLIKYVKENKISLDKTVYIGNDINDIHCLEMVGFPLAPKDAYPDIKGVENIHIMESLGGQGLVRELLSYF